MKTHNQRKQARDSAIKKEETCMDISIGVVDGKTYRKLGLSSPCTQKCSFLNSTSDDNQYFSTILSVIHSKLESIPFERYTGGIIDGPPEGLEKYWVQRYNLFSKFDEGIQLDEEAWFEVCAENVGVHAAKTISVINALDIFLSSSTFAGSSTTPFPQILPPPKQYRPVIDFCAGVGGIAIHMAREMGDCVAVDWDAGRISMLKHNAGVYGVEDKIESVVEDAMEYCQRILETQNKSGNEYTFQTAIFSFPWGGLMYNKKDVYSFVSSPLDVVKSIVSFSSVAKNVVLHAPRKTSMKEIISIASSCGFSYVEVEKLYHFQSTATKVVLIYLIRNPIFPAYRIEYANTLLKNCNVADLNKYLSVADRKYQLLDFFRFTLIALLKENEKTQSSAFTVLLSNLTFKEVLDLIAITWQVEKKGGMTYVMEEQTKRRTLGGVFFNLVKCLYPHVYKEIEFKRKIEKHLK